MIGDFLMLDATESLLPLLGQEKELRVICVGLEEDSIDELKRLLTTLGVKPVDQITIASKRINPATYMGRGKIDEVRQAIERNQAHAVILDVELSPNQLRNLEKELNMPIMDRPGVIIEIFSQHARTKESKTQVALARLQYLLPRLT